jgi:hypothetical protein
MRLNVSIIEEGAWCDDIIATCPKPCAGLGQETLSVVLAHGGKQHTGAVFMVVRSAYQPGSQ